MNKRVTGYKIDFSANTLTMNYKFADAAKEYNSAEYKIVKDIQSDFPTIKIIIKAGRNITTPRPTKRMTYVNMEKYILAYDNAEELLKIFNRVKAISVILKSPYKYVHDWFVMQFPNYKDIPETTKPTLYTFPIAAPNIESYTKKNDKVS